MLPGICVAYLCCDAPRAGCCQRLGLDGPMAWSSVANFVSLCCCWHESTELPWHSLVSTGLSTSFLMCTCHLQSATRCHLQAISFLPLSVIVKNLKTLSRQDLEMGRQGTGLVFQTESVKKTPSKNPSIFRKKKKINHSCYSSCCWKCFCEENGKCRAWLLKWEK